MSNINYRKIIYNAGLKGGSGKTTTSAALATGLYYFGYSSIVVATDPEEEVRKDVGRKYFTKEAYTRDALDKVIKKFLTYSPNDKIALIIDGVANRINQDIEISKKADMTIIPTKGSPGDYSRTAKQLYDIPGSLWFLNDEDLNNKFRMEKVRSEIREHLAPYADRMLNPVKRCASLKDFSSFKEKIDINTDGKLVCQMLAYNVLERSGFDPKLMEAEFQEKQSQLRSQRAKERYAQNQAKQAQGNATE